SDLGGLVDVVNEHRLVFLHQRRHQRKTHSSQADKTNLHNVSFRSHKCTDNTSPQPKPLVGMSFLFFMTADENCTSARHHAHEARGRAAWTDDVPESRPMSRRQCK